MRIRVDQVQIDVNDRSRDHSRDWARRLLDQGARIDRGVAVNPSVLAPPVAGKSGSERVLDEPDAATRSPLSDNAARRAGEGPHGRRSGSGMSGRRGGARAGGYSPGVAGQERIRRQREAVQALAAPVAVLARMPRPGLSPAAVQAQSDFLGACLVVLPQLENELDRLAIVAMRKADGALEPEDEAVLKAAGRWVSFADARLIAYFDNPEGPELESVIAQTTENAALLMGLLRVASQDRALGRASQGFAVAARALVPLSGVEPAGRLEAEQRLYADIVRLASRFGAMAVEVADQAGDGPGASVMAILMAQIAFLSGSGAVIRGAPAWTSFAPVSSSGLARMAAILRRCG